MESSVRRHRDFHACPSCVRIRSLYIERFRPCIYFASRGKYRPASGVCRFARRPGGGCCRQARQAPRRAGRGVHEGPFAWGLYRVSELDPELIVLYAQGVPPMAAAAASGTKDHGGNCRSRPTHVILSAFSVRGRSVLSASGPTHGHLKAHF